MTRSERQRLYLAWRWARAMDARMKADGLSVRDRLRVMKKMTDGAAVLPIAQALSLVPPPKLANTTRTRAYTVPMLRVAAAMEQLTVKA